MNKKIESTIGIPIDVFAIRFVKSFGDCGFNDNSNIAPIKGRNNIKDVYINIFSLLIFQCHQHLCFAYFCIKQL